MHRKSLPARVRLIAAGREAGAWGARALATVGRSTAALALILAGVLALGVVLAQTAGTDGNKLAAGAGATIDEAAARQQAADRADRSRRGAAGTTTPTPTTAPKAGGTLAAAAKVAPPKAPAWVLPMAGVPLSSCYGWRWGTVHQGIDFAGPAGTKIVSVGAGTVTAAGWLYAGYGISVLVDHGNGFLTHYAHASRVLVHAGQRVKPGTPLAIEGSTGDSTGPHLHFEVHRGALWQQLNPAPWLRARGIKIGC